VENIDLLDSLKRENTRFGEELSWPTSAELCTRWVIDFREHGLQTRRDQDYLAHVNRGGMRGAFASLETMSCSVG
jgi:hypothetical protein